MGSDHYDHYSPEMIRRLDGFFGAVDGSINERIALEIDGKAVLEIGCGFGSLVDYLRTSGFAAVGIDQLEMGISAGKARFPEADLRLTEGERLPFPDKSFDTVVLKDTLHHVFTESDFRSFLGEVKRVCRRRLVVVDPNPTWILRTCRKLIGHVDPVCSPADAKGVLTEAGFLVEGALFSEIFAFPLSGGYVGRPLVPRIAWLYSPLLALDRVLLGLLRKLGLSQLVSWRYLIVARLA